MKHINFDYYFLIYKELASGKQIESPYGLDETKYLLLALINVYI